MKITIKKEGVEVEVNFAIQGEMTSDDFTRELLCPLIREIGNVGVMFSGEEKEEK